VLDFIIENLLLIIFILLIARYVLKERKVTAARVVIYMIFLFYMYQVLKLTGIVNIFLNHKAFALSSDSLSFAFNNSQFKPLLFYREGMAIYGNDFTRMLFSSYFRSSLYNFIMLIPLGIFIPWLYKHLFAKTMTDAFILVFAIESVQFVSNICNLSSRSFNVDDFILNLLGVAVGYLLYHVVIKNILPKTLTK